MARLTEEHSGVWPVQSPNSTPPPSPQSGLKGHCVSGKIVAGYNPLLKVTIFQQHLTHTYTQIETGEGGKKKKKRGLHRIVYCACKIYVLWSPAINTHCFSIKVRINPPIRPPLEISLFFARQTGATKTFVCLFCSFPISSFPCCKIFILFFFQLLWMFLLSLMCTHRTLLLVVSSLALCKMCA